MRCPACSTENVAGRKFCAECGTRLASPCPSCGAVNDPGAKFCGECGTALASAGQAPAGGPAGDEASGPAVAERRIVSVLFVDLVGFTALTEGRDPEVIRDLQERYFATTRTIVERYGGTLEKYIGDAVMAVWGAPTAHEDDPERAVRAALDIVLSVAALGFDDGPRLAGPWGRDDRRGGRLHRRGGPRDGQRRARQRRLPAPKRRARGRRADRRGDPSGDCLGYRLDARRRAGREGPLGAHRRLARDRRAGDARWGWSGRSARAAVRRARLRAPAAQGPAPRGRRRIAGAARVGHRDRRDRQEPARLGAREVHRRHRQRRLLAPGPFAGLRRGDRLLGARRDGPGPGGHRRGRGRRGHPGQADDGPRRVRPGRDRAPHDGSLAPRAVRPAGGSRGSHRGGVRRRPAAHGADRRTGRCGVRFRGPPVGRPGAHRLHRIGPRVESQPPDPDRDPRPARADRTPSDVGCRPAQLHRPPSRAAVRRGDDRAARWRGPGTAAPVRPADRRSGRRGAPVRGRDDPHARRRRTARPRR